MTISLPPHTCDADLQQGINRAGRALKNTFALFLTAGNTIRSGRCRAKELSKIAFSQYAFAAALFRAQEKRIASRPYNCLHPSG